MNDCGFLQCSSGVLGGGTRYDFVILSSAKSNKFDLLSWCVGDVGPNMPSKSDCNMKVCRMWKGKKKQNKEKRLVRHPSMH